MKIVVDSNLVWQFAGSLVFAKKCYKTIYISVFLCLTFQTNVDSTRRLISINQTFPGLMKKQCLLHTYNFFLCAKYAGTVCQRSSI